MLRLMLTWRTLPLYVSSILVNWLLLDCMGSCVWLMNYSSLFCLVTLVQWRQMCFPLQEEMVQKHVFVLFFQGEQLRVRVRKICEG